MTRFVDPHLGQHRPAVSVPLDGQIGAWRRPKWQRDPVAYRCQTCATVVPWSLWLGVERAAWEANGERPKRCQGCETDAPPEGGGARD